MFDEDVLHSFFLAFLENFLPRNNSFPDVHDVSRRVHVLDVEQRETSPIFLHESNRIGSAVSNPVHVHLEDNELRICVLDQEIEWHLSIDRWKLVVVIVKSELKSRLLCLLARLVEQICNLLVTVERSVFVVDPRAA